MIDPTGRGTHWPVQLASYDFDGIYKKGEETGNADCLSRMPISEDKEEILIRWKRTRILVKQRAVKTQI